ncbi:STAS domain-containing protein [Ruthenibacterium sp. TH_2024_36131]|uniref:STAS domain-containing protein n=1 Tax=Owariibacterium komagatae TaxID=3136601 RepID=UPI0038B299BA
MNIEQQKSNDSLTLFLSGRLDTVTAPQLEEHLNANLDGVSSLVLDFSELNYISSAGLRVLLTAQKRMNRQGSMVVRHVNDVIAEVFEITGFCDILTVE